MSRSEEFRALHAAGEPLVLPNAWDYASGARSPPPGTGGRHHQPGGGAAAAAGRGRGDAGRDGRADPGAGRLPVLVTSKSKPGWRRSGRVAELAATLAGAGRGRHQLEDSRATAPSTDPPGTPRDRGDQARAPELFQRAHRHVLAARRGRPDPLAPPSTGSPSPGGGADAPSCPHRDRDAITRWWPPGCAQRAVPAGRHTLPELAGSGGPGVHGSLLFRAALPRGRAPGRSVPAVPDTAGLPSYAECSGSRGARPGSCGCGRGTPRRPGRRTTR